MSILDVLNQGGLVMYVILVCSVVALAVTMERIFSLVRLARTEDAFHRRVSDAMVKGSIAEAVDLCESNPTPSARIVGAALAKHGASRAEVREAADDAGAREVDRLSRNLVILATIAQIAPLLGLLGTVLGMMDTFYRIEQSAGGLVDPDVLSGGIRKALLTTAFGLSVAIPTLVAYASLSAWVNRLIGRTEQVAGATVEVVASGPEPGGGAKQGGAQ